MTGSPRYMVRCNKEPLPPQPSMWSHPFKQAPEVAMEHPYNESCDAYSFGILFWEIYSGRKPFELYGMKNLQDRVWTGEHKRPFVQEAWPVAIKSFMRRSWSKEPKERPNFAQIYKILKNECVRTRDGKEDGLEHNRRRSTFVLRTSSRQAIPRRQASKE